MTPPNNYLPPFWGPLFKGLGNAFGLLLGRLHGLWFTLVVCRSRVRACAQAHTHEWAQYEDSTGTTHYWCSNCPAKFKEEKVK